MGRGRQVKWGGLIAPCACWAVSKCDDEGDDDPGGHDHLPCAVVGWGDSFCMARAIVKGFMADNQCSVQEDIKRYNCIPENHASVSKLSI